MFLNLHIGLPDGLLSFRCETTVYVDYIFPAPYVLPIPLPDSCSYIDFIPNKSYFACI